MSTPIFSRLSRVWATSRCLTIPTSTSRVALTSRSPSSFFTPHLLHKKSPLPAVPLNARGFSQSYLLQFARSRFSSSRQNWYPPPPRGGGTGSSGFLNGLRRRVDRINPDTIFYGIIGINVAVFGGWWYANENWTKFRDPALVWWMRNNFTTSLRNLREGRVWTLLTSCFSHNAVDHILLNLMTFYFMAQPVISLLGNSRFLILYLGGGIVSSILSSAWSLTRGRTEGSSHGASGAIYAVTAFYATLFPRTTFLIFFIIPAPAWLVVGGLALWDLGSAITDRRLGTDTAGHLGGILAGFAFGRRILSKGRF